MHMRIIIILFAITLVAFKQAGSPTKHTGVKGQVDYMIVVANAWETFPGEIALIPGRIFESLLSKSIRVTEKKWFPKRWIFRPPMEPI